MKKPMIMLMLLALGSGACAAKRAGDYNYESYDYADAAAEPMADGEYGGGYDDVAYEEAEMDAPAPPAKESRVRFGARKAKRGDRSPATEVVASAPAGGAAPEPAVAPSDGAEPAIADETPDEVGRHIIYTASMSMSVFNLDDAMEATEALPEKYGGYIASMSSGTFVLRIPSKNLRKLMNDVGELGVVEARSMTAQDVTDEYFDVESRITALEKTHAQLLELLGKARNVQEALEVRRSLDEIAMELEVLKGRMRKLQNMISFSTLTISLVERGPHMPTPSSNDPFPWVDGLGVEATEWK